VFGHFDGDCAAAAPRPRAMVLHPGHFAVKFGCGMVGGCRKPNAPTGTPWSGTHLCTLCERRVVNFSNPSVRGKPLCQGARGKAPAAAWPRAHHNQ
jgi:hypothetical protein